MTIKGRLAVGAGENRLDVGGRGHARGVDQHLIVEGVGADLREVGRGDPKSGSRPVRPSRAASPVIASTAAPAFHSADLAVSPAPSANAASARRSSQTGPL